MKNKKRINVSGNSKEVEKKRNWKKEGEVRRRMKGEKGGEVRRKTRRERKRGGKQK